MQEVRTRAGTDFTIIRVFRTFINITENAQRSMSLYIISHGRRKLDTDYVSTAPSQNIIVLEGSYRIIVLLNANTSELKTF